MIKRLQWILDGLNIQKIPKVFKGAVESTHPIKTLLKVWEIVCIKHSNKCLGFQHAIFWVQSDRKTGQTHPLKNYGNILGSPSPVTILTSPRTHTARRDFVTKGGIIHIRVAFQRRDNMTCFPSIIAINQPISCLIVNLNP